MQAVKILIVEDEILIADTIQRYLERQGYEVVGIAISYEEAVELYQQTQPDLCLIDIRLSGQKTGIDFAHFIQKQPNPKPFIYLTSQLDKRYINMAKETFPAGYLSKPIQKASLFANIEIATHSHQTKVSKETKITIFDGSSKHVVPIKDILYIQADHIYAVFYTSSKGRIMQRSTLSEVLKQLPSPPFVQVHRSFIVNLKHITGWDQQQLFVNDKAIPVSRSRKKEILSYLKNSRRS